MSRQLHCKLTAFCFLSYFSFHLNKHPCGKQKGQPNHKVHNYHVQSRELQDTLYFPPSVSFVRVSHSDTNTESSRSFRALCDAHAFLCAGEKARFNSKCGFSSPCHLKAFQLTFHVILHLIINSQGKRTSNNSEYKTNF